MGNEIWFCTDSDCLQYCKKESDTEFSFIQAVWLDTCKNDVRAKNAKDESDNYTVCAGSIDIELYNEDDIESSLSSYGYTIESVKETYGEYANQIIAECLFEDNCLHDWNLVTGVVSWDEAEKTIQNYIYNY